MLHSKGGHSPRLLQDAQPTAGDAMERSQQACIVLALCSLGLGFVAPVLAETATASCATTAPCQPISAPNPTRCAELETQLRAPMAFIAGGQIQLDKLEAITAEWMGGYCYRVMQGDAYAWPHDRTARDTGPFFAQIMGDEASGFSIKPKGITTHVVARVWYSPDMHAWMLKNRPANEADAPSNPDPIPTGAIVVKEMWPSPAAQFVGDCFDCMKPGSGAVIFVRDAESFSAGWWVGWWGDGYTPSWPPAASNPLTGMGDGGQQFCSNCHASTQPGNTFVSINNLDGHPATFLTQSLPATPAPPARHVDNAIPPPSLERIDDPLPGPSAGFHEIYVDLNIKPLATALKPLSPRGERFGERGQLPPCTESAPTTPCQSTPINFPSQTYDSVLVPGHGPLDYFMPSSQCVGCHQAGATGLQIDMLDYGPTPLRGGSKQPVSISPYSLWSSSPMGLAGRDPIFYAQLESEQILHADLDKNASPAQKSALRSLIQDTCLQCHGVMGQRQHAIDQFDASGDCGSFARDAANAVPFPHGAMPWPEQAQQASYGALARDGISCTVCHRLALDEQADEVNDKPWNTCIQQKQASLNPNYTGFARTFTGSFPVAEADQINGPFADPLVKPMQNALRLTPQHNESISSSEVCGSCHTIHLPVLDREQPEDRCGPQTDPPDPFRCFPKRYEQTTYAEWVFSAYRTGSLGKQPLPSGPGATPRSCQDCHMPSRNADGTPLQSKVAAIEEYSNYPQTDYRLDAEDIDLPLRDGFARHVLVGLNLFLVEMAQQYPDVFGIRSEDPGLGGSNLAPLQVTENAILDQAANATTRVSAKPVWDDIRHTLTTEVTVENLAGHKFPSGVGFRRAFIEFSVLDAKGQTLWISGNTNEHGVLVDSQGKPLDGELWWQANCSTRLENSWQPHYQQITARNQTQIYQELITNAKGQLTTSFLAINEHLKDNRLQPHGLLPESERLAIAAALGDTTPAPKPGEFAMDQNLARAVGPEGEAEHDPDYSNGSGADRISYVVKGLDGPPAAVRARVLYQAIPPSYLQDRFCTAVHAAGTTVGDSERLNWLVGKVDMVGEAGGLEGWKLVVGDSGVVGIGVGGTY